MNYKKILVFVAAISLLVISILFMSDDLMSPYVSIADAKKDAGKLVQIIGELDATRPQKHTGEKFYYSVIDEDNTKVDVEHKGVKPLNFERADQIVSIGRYDSKSNLFKADKILIKCPSKYEVEYKERLK